MTGSSQFSRSARQSGVHAHPYGTVTVLVTFVSVQTPSELGQRVKLPATHAHFCARVSLHNFVERTAPPLGYRLGPGDSDAKARGHWELYVGIPNLENCRWNITASQHNIRMVKWVRAARGNYCWVPESESGGCEPDHLWMDKKCRLCKPEGQFKIRYNKKKQRIPGSGIVWITTTKGGWEHHVLFHTKWIRKDGRLCRWIKRGL
jgi:hypothetical protein